MTIKVTFSQAKDNFGELCDRVIDEDEIIKISRKSKGQNRNRDIIIMSAAELEGLLETIYLLRSPKNAKRLLDALNRAQAQIDKPS
jgi:antitoxin YefM